MCVDLKVSCVFSIITNGYLINQSILTLFHEIELRQIQITLDGNESVHNNRRKLSDGSGTYNTIIRNVYTLVENGFNVTIRVNIDKTNIDSFQTIKTLFDNSSQIFCYPALVTEETSQCLYQKNSCFKHNEYSNFYKTVSTNTFNGLDVLPISVCNCSAEHINSFVVDHIGNIYKCLNDLGNDEYLIRTVFDENHSTYKSISKYLGRDPFTEKECNTCAYLPLCYGGCVWEFLDKNSHACLQEKFLFESMLLNYLQKDEV